MSVLRGDVFFADLNPVVGSEQGGLRPVLVIQNDVGNLYSPTTIVAAITSRIKRAKLPTHVELSAARY
ncbi:MAG: type II toxin-antitoxin system PemK/MazF family toxin, partial [Firmicutes bacterium]|nr:type II toxin-antitoxin system PemK/MazF family toxin [Bacillota bacterium]